MLNVANINTKLTVRKEYRKSKQQIHRKSTAATDKEGTRFGYIITHINGINTGPTNIRPEHFNGNSFKINVQLLSFMLQFILTISFPFFYVRIYYFITVHDYQDT